MTFPKDFVWGAATASYQIEGASLEDGRGECIWTRFSHTPGNVLNGDTGDVACDHYHRFREDIQLMKNLGLKAYRFSISWPRVIPAGTGASNAAGLEFYDQLVDELLKADITPFATLYHWDLPQKLQDQGGWENPASVQWFADYTNVVTRRLGDRVQYWATHNEPWVVAFVGNLQGRHAPGLTDVPTAFKVAHHLLLSHAAGVEVIRRNVNDAQAGIVLSSARVEPASDDAKDVKAAQIHDGYILRWMLDPLLKGHYPADVVEHLGGPDGEWLSGIDLSAVQAAAVPLDFLGINYYFRETIAWDESDALFNRREIKPPDSDYTKMDWEIHPEGIYKLLTRLNREYKLPPIYITENGAAFEDQSPVNGGIVHDPKRVAYLQGHLKALEKALDEGVPLKGYFVWSLLDNFEWGYGYDRRFGIVYVDFETLKRTPKQSALWYGEVIAANGVVG